MSKINSLYKWCLSLTFLCSVTHLCAAECPLPDDKYTYRLPEPDNLPIPPIPQRPLPLRSASIRTFSQRRGLIFGIDVSRYQEQINWQMVATDPNVQFAYIKATESSGHVDKYYQRNLSEARRFGIPVGAYHFFSPTASVSTQLKNFTDQFKLKYHDLIPVVDVERRGRASSASFHRRLTEFLKQIERIYGIRPIIYTGVNFYNEHMAGRYTQYKFWVARYADQPPKLVDGTPVVLWQFTCNGYVNGVKGEVDRNCFLDQFTLQDILLPRK